MRSSCLVECLAMAGSRRARAITSRVMGLIKSPIQVLQVTSSLAGSLWRWSLAGFNCPILDWVFVLIRSSVKSNPMASLFGFPWSRDSAFGVNWYFLPNITSVVWHHVEVRGTAAHAVAVKHHFGVNASGPREGDQRSHWSCPNPSGPPPPPSGVAGEQEIFGTNCRETGTSVVGNPATFGTSRAGKTALKSEMVGFLSFFLYCPVSMAIRQVLLLWLELFFFKSFRQELRVSVVGWGSNLDPCDQETATLTTTPRLHRPEQ